jgi:hypothetical protein
MLSPVSPSPHAVEDFERDVVEASRRGPVLYDGDGARRAAVAIFGVLGEEDPVVKEHRPSFNTSLY